MVKVGILAIGSELLEGSIVDTNSAWLGSKLTKAGFNVDDVRLIPDDREKIVTTMKEALEKYDIVLTTGGLGPTFDDITAEAMAEATGVELEMCEEARQHMIKRLQKYGVTIKESHERQALLPKGCLIFPNVSGTAMGFAMEQNGNVIASMPGVPYEMYNMFDNHVLPFLLERHSLKERISIDVRIGGLPESDIDDVVIDMNLPEEVECIINVAKGECLVKFRGFDKAQIEKCAEHVAKAFPKNFVGYGDDGLASVLIRLLKEKKMTISVAESCTGVMIGKELTEISGSSEVFMGGIISYSNEAKERLLRVPHNIMVLYGAVSVETAKAMAVGVANQLRTQCSIAVTGIAGPGGGTEEKPVGTICLAYSVNNEVTTKKYEYMGDRDAIRTRAMKTALREMIDLLK
ncbi:MAG: competence/damage-inducible protein A [Denitrovibrio sp.]|nr:MAG: competence/damage-inducible protein A [Denitrovibrio sp.]